jgi:hypothetical protein
LVMKIIGTAANTLKQQCSSQGINFGSEGWGFESLQARHFLVL